MFDCYVVCSMSILETLQSRFLPTPSKATSSMFYAWSFCRVRRAQPEVSGSGTKDATAPRKTNLRLSQDTLMMFFLGATGPHGLCDNLLASCFAVIKFTSIFNKTRLVSLKPKVAVLKSSSAACNFFVQPGQLVCLAFIVPTVQP